MLILIMISKYTDLYATESNCISKGIDLNDINKFNNLSSIYSESVFKEMIETDINIINSTPLNLNSILVVGDIHGSIIQLFTPLVSAGLIKNIRYSFIKDKFEFDYCDENDKNEINDETIDNKDENDKDENDKDENDKDENNKYNDDKDENNKYNDDKDENNKYNDDKDKDEINDENNDDNDKIDKNENNINSKVIYTGDILYRGIHSHIMAMIEALIEIIYHYKFKKVIWIFGNHDIEFIKFSGVPFYTLSEYFKASSRFENIHSLFRKFAVQNPYPFCYIDKSKNFMVSHTIQTSENIKLFMEYYNILFKTHENIISGPSMAIKLNHYMNNIIKFMISELKPNLIHSQYSKSTIYHLCISNLYWTRPTDGQSYTYHLKYHFIGHTPVYDYDKLELKIDSKIIHTILLCDYNTMNDEYEDNCTYFKINNNFKSNQHEINESQITILKNRIKYSFKLDENTINNINFIKCVLNDLLQN